MDIAQVRSIASLGRGLDVLALVARHQGLVLHELHAATGIPKASLLRILKTLLEHGLVRKRAGDGSYLSSIPSPQGTQAHQAAVDPSKSFPELLHKLRERLPWPSDIAVPSGVKMRVVDSNRASYGRAWRPSVIGEEVDMLESAMGRAYLASLSTDACRLLVDRILAGSQARARRREAIELEIASTRKRGFGLRDFRYAGPDTDHGRQLSAVAVPILSGSSVVACVSCVWDLRTTSRAEILESALAHLVRLASACAG